jgi:hypothetical protein
MLLKKLPLLGLMFPLTAKAQDDFNQKLTKAVSDCRYQNLYHFVTWGFAATNAYVFDQDKGTVTYSTDHEDLTIVAKPEILGTFNLKQKTFLWGDKNKFADPKLTANLEAFRKQLPEAYTKEKVKTDVDLCEKLLALYSKHLDANAYDYRRQDETIIFFSLMQIDVLRKDTLLKSLPPKPHTAIIQNDALIETIKEYHNEKMEVNRLYQSGKLSNDSAFKAMEDIQIKYRIGHNYDVSLCDRCNYDKQYATNWAVIKFNENERIFVVYSSNYMNASLYHYSYEIDAKAVGKQVILDSY